jgi:putative ABC transport system permease protein
MMHPHPERNPLPPRWADRLLTWLSPPELLEEVQGDLHELFAERVREAGVRVARRQYWLDVLGFGRPYFLKRKPNPYPQPLHTDMLKNYFTTAWRNLTRQPGYTLLNTAGLAFGLTCFLLIALYVVDELRYDAFHTHAPDLYRVGEQKTSAAGKETRVASVAFNLSAAAAPQLPEVVNSAVIMNLGRRNIANGENKNVFYIDFRTAPQSFLDMFDFPLLAGDRATALKEPFSVIMTRSMARRIFGTDQVLGKALLVEGDSPFRITAVLEDVPAYSHLQFELFFSQATHHSQEWFRDLRSKDWNSNSFLTYLQLKPGVRAAAVAPKLEKIVDGHREPALAAAGSFFLQPITDIHLRSAGIEGAEGGSITYVYVFSAVALLVLLIACLNYMNMATARAAGRAREVGVRKVVGARGRNLVTQFLTESLLVAFIALAVALVAVNLALPGFNAFTGKSLSLHPGTEPAIWAGVLIATILVGVVSGSYPAFYLSAVEPFRALKGGGYAPGGALAVRRTLVVFQFTLSIVMIAATLVTYRQMNYVRTKDLGFNQQLLVVIDINSGLVRRSFETIKNELNKLPAVGEVTVSSRVPGDWKTVPQVALRTAAGTGETKSHFIGADDHFLRTYGVALLKGRNFFAGTSDSTAVILNETAARALGITEPKDQPVDIGAITFDGNRQDLAQPLKVRVVGIARDFHFQSLHEKVAPMVLAHWKNPAHYIDYFTVRLTGTQLPETVAAMEEVLTRIDPEHLFEYHFLDQQWARFYEEDQRRERILAASALAAIVIACLGVFGLAAYVAQQRTKEIGIRKVLGANSLGIAALLSKDFIRLVLLANLFAWPVAWYATRLWLRQFAYRIEPGWGLFVLAGGVALGIAVLTVGYQAVKAALVNPVKSLRSE